MQISSYLPVEDFFQMENILSKFLGNLQRLSHWLHVPGLRHSAIGRICNVKMDHSFSSYLFSKPFVFSR